jgi:hypothetical protein
MDYKTLIDILENAGFEPRSYSGRGMSGRQCVGVTVPDVKAAYGLLIRECDYGSDAADLIDAAREDNMGRSFILYWPRVAWEE